MPRRARGETHSAWPLPAPVSLRCPHFPLAGGPHHPLMSPLAPPSTTTREERGSRPQLPSSPASALGLSEASGFCPQPLPPGVTLTGGQLSLPICLALTSLKCSAHGLGASANDRRCFWKVRRCWPGPWEVSTQAGDTQRALPACMSPGHAQVFREETQGQCGPWRVSHPSLPKSVLPETVLIFPFLQ